MKYWINAVSRDHVMLGVKGGFTQANHGKNTLLKRLKVGEWVIFYSSKTSYMNDEPLQAFTAIGQIKDGELYQGEMPDGRTPWRIDMKFYDSQETPIRPLLNDLSFIKDPAHWGYPFRFGLFEIPKADFNLIKSAMLKVG